MNGFTRRSFFTSAAAVTAVQPVGAAPRQERKVWTGKIAWHNYPLGLLMISIGDGALKCAVKLDARSNGDPLKTRALLRPGQVVELTFEPQTSGAHTGRYAPGSLNSNGENLVLDRSYMSLTSQQIAFAEGCALNPVSARS